MNSKRKGNAGELELLHLLEERGILCHRNEQGMFAGFRGGKANPDIWAKVGGKELHCEVKRTERFALYPALDQAQRDADGTATVPVVVHRMNRKPWVVVLKLEDFLTMMQEKG